MNRETSERIKALYAQRQEQRRDRTAVTKASVQPSASSALNGVFRWVRETFDKARHSDD